MDEESRVIMFKLNINLNSRKMKRYIFSLTSFFLGYIIISSLANTSFLPSIQIIIKSLKFLLDNNILQKSIIDSLYRLLSGFLLGSAIGLFLGLIMGMNRKLDYALDPLIEIPRFVPSLAFLPLFIIWFGGGELSRISLIALGAMIATWPGTYHGVRDIPLIYLYASINLGASKWLLFKNIILPAAMPRIFSALRISLGASWTIIVAAELMGAESGLGYLLSIGREFTSVSVIFISLFCIAILAIIMDTFLRIFFGRMIKWMKRIER
jgi:sulfonate transport system permease protein